MERLIPAASPAQEATPPRECLCCGGKVCGVGAAPTPEASAPEPPCEEWAVGQGNDYELATHDRWNDWRLDHPEDLSRIVVRLGYKAAPAREASTAPTDDEAARSLRTAVNVALAFLPYGYDRTRAILESLPATVAALTAARNLRPAPPADNF